LILTKNRKKSFGRVNFVREVTQR